jgi:hypothetical protein
MVGISLQESQDQWNCMNRPCDSDHYLVVAKVRERLSVSKQMVKKMDVGRFNRKQLSVEEVKEQYQVTIKK